MSAGFLDYLKTGQAETVPVLPVLFHAVADIEGADIEAMLADPAWLTRVLLNAQALFAAEAVAVRFDSGSVAEPLLDVVARLASDLKRRVPVVACFPVDGDAGAVDMRGLADAACKAGASLVLVYAVPGFDDDAARILKPVANTVRYYARQLVVANALVPKSCADALVLPWGQTVDQAAGPRVGHRLPASSQARPGDLPGVPAGRFVLVDDADVAGLSAPEITERLARLRALRPDSSP
jgi:hypothetical protein